MDDVMSWTDSRDGQIRKVRTYWGGAMGVGPDVDFSKITALRAPRLIEFVPADGRRSICRTGLADDERAVEEHSDEELQNLLDRALG